MNLIKPTYIANRQPILFTNRLLNTYSNGSWHDEATAFLIYYLLMSVLGLTCFLTSVNSELSGEQVSGSRRKSAVLVLDEIVIVSIETAVRRELE